MYIYIHGPRLLHITVCIKTTYQYLPLTIIINSIQSSYYKLTTTTTNKKLKYNAYELFQCAYYRVLI